MGHTRAAGFITLSYHQSRKRWQYAYQSNAHSNRQLLLCRNQAIASEVAAVTSNYKYHGQLGITRRKYDNPKPEELHCQYPCNHCGSHRTTTIGLWNWDGGSINSLKYRCMDCGKDSRHG